MTKKVDAKELETLQQLNGEFQKIKTQIGDAELQKYGLFLQVQTLKEDFQKIENELINKHGKDSVINLQTGEITQKPQKEAEDGKNK